MNKPVPRLLVADPPRVKWRAEKRDATRRFALGVSRAASHNTEAQILNMIY